MFFTCADARPHGFHLKSGDARAPVQENSAWVIQSGKKAMIDWEGFSIDQKEIVRFQQMDTNSYVLNRVVGKSESALLGQLLSNGSVYLINPNGILIGSNAYIETASFIASTLDLLSEDLSGKALRFSGESGKGVINKGIIHCPAGDIFLIGRQVENDGTLSSPRGRQGLLSGCDVLIQPKGAPQILIRSDVVMDAKELAENPYALAIRHRGSSTAKEVYLATEGLCEVSGSIAAPEGGTVHLLGEDVHLLNGARIDASGAHGGGEILIGGDYQGKNPEIRNAKHVWAGQDTQVRADALENGDGGKVIFWSDEATLHYGKISICGGPEGGNGGLAEVSGHTLEYRGFTDGSAPLGQTGMLLLDPTNIVIGAAATTNTFSACIPPVTYNINTGVSPNQIRNTDLQTQLASCNVTVDTSSAGADTGSITVSSAVTWAANTTLTLNANSFMSITAGITNTNATPGFTAMNFTANGTSAAANDGILLSGASAVLTTNTGNVTLNGTSS
ncbi:MAG TPA: filamentous hemagglutinin N-terminal domain-containing protein, partial [Terriglobales bacterium]|nr:filamentous hemagglutinin N-terminal domain-containing protein [Terriglobales bacterium]